VTGQRQVVCASLLAGVLAAGLLTALARPSRAAEALSKDASDYQAGVALVERGRIKLQQAALSSLRPAERQRSRQQARALDQQALQAFTDLEARCAEEFAKFPKFINPKDTKRIAAQRQVRRDLLEVRLALAAVSYELAQTYPAGSGEHKEHLVAAAKKYHALYEDCGAVLAGLYARLYEGRCYRELGQTEQALAAFKELLAQPDEPEALAALRRQALILALQTALLPKVNKHDEALALYQAWERSSRLGEELGAEILAIRYLAGEAALQSARSALTPGPPPATGEGKDSGRAAKNAAQRRAEMIEVARRLWESVAQSPGAYQQQARIALRAEEFAGAEAAPPAPIDFTEANDRATAALRRMSAAERQRQADQEQPSAADLVPYDGQIAEARQEALKYFRIAWEKRPSDLPAHERDRIRYCLAYLHWKSGDAHEAAVLGEHLARHCGETTRGLEGAKIALAAWARLFNDALPGDCEVEARHMAAIAAYVTDRWASEPAAEDARIMLIRAAALHRRTQEALGQLAKIPPDSPRRGEAELLTGQALWSSYLEAVRLPADQRPQQAELDEMVTQGRKTLEEAIRRMRPAVDDGGEATDTLADCVLALAQILVETGRAAEAVPWIEDPKVGLRILVVSGGSPATNKVDFAVETCKTALRAYVGVGQWGEAEKAMDSLPMVVQATSAAQATWQLARIYIGLGQEVQRQLDRLCQQQKRDQAKDVARNFAQFVARVAARGQQNTFPSLLWVAEMYRSLGAGLDQEGTKRPDAIADYDRSAAATYQRILQRCDDPQFGAPKGAAVSIAIRRAGCLRRLGQYQEALTILTEALKDHDRLVDAQKEAAYTLQAWGQQKPECFQLAISGGRQYKHIWGWQRLAQQAGRFPQYQDLFHEARYNLALCRLRLAESQDDQDKRAATLQQAADDIRAVEGLSRDMGGRNWYDKYNALLNKIQKLRGEQPVGLPAPRAAATTESGQ